LAYRTGPSIPDLLGHFSKIMVGFSCFHTSVAHELLALSVFPEVTPPLSIGLLNLEEHRCESGLLFW
jgi:hypothetical protein